MYNTYCFIFVLLNQFTMNYGLVPLRNFALVDETKNIFRSAQPQYSYEYKFIKDVLGVKTIVNLRSELDHDSKMNSGLSVYSISIPDHCTPTLDDANDYITFVRNNNDFLFHCEHGRGRTSTFCVLTKLALGMSIEDAIKEEKEIYGYNFQHQMQLDFLLNNFK